MWKLSCNGSLKSIHPLPTFLFSGDSIGDVCPTGSYCPEGTDEPIECPVGTYNPDEGRMNVTECLSCIGGSHCNSTGKCCNSHNY